MTEPTNENPSPAPSSDASSPPSPWVTRFAPLISGGGSVLDLACGRGRHARYLASLGYRVEALDRDSGVLAGLQGLPGIETRAADVEGGPWPYHARAFDGIVVTNYLFRPLLPMLLNAMDEAGVLIYETFMVGHERFGRPSNPAYLLRPGELLEVVRRRLAIVAFEQGEVAGSEHEPPRVVQRLCATRRRESVLPTW